MPTVDLYVKLRGFWYDRKIYRDIREHSITYNDYFVLIEYKTINKKTGLESKYNISIPKTELGFIAVKINE